MDYQSGVVSLYVKDEGLMDRAGRALRHLRSLGMLVIHVTVGFRPGLPEVSPRNLLLSAIKSSTQHRGFFEGAAGAIHPAVARVRGWRHHIQRFLRARLIQRLVITRVPVSIGTGIPLFGPLERDIVLRHVATRHSATSRGGRCFRNSRKRARLAEAADIAVRTTRRQE